VNDVVTLLLLLLLLLLGLNARQAMYGTISSLHSHAVCVCVCASQLLNTSRRWPPYLLFPRRSSSHR